MKSNKRRVGHNTRSTYGVEAPRCSFDGGYMGYTDNRQTAIGKLLTETQNRGISPLQSGTIIA